MCFIQLKSIQKQMWNVNNKESYSKISRIKFRITDVSHYMQNSTIQIGSNSGHSCSQLHFVEKFQNGVSVLLEYDTASLGNSFSTFLNISVVLKRRKLITQRYNVVSQKKVYLSCTAATGPKARNFQNAYYFPLLSTINESKPRDNPPLKGKEVADENSLSPFVCVCVSFRVHFNFNSTRLAHKLRNWTERFQLTFVLEVTR